MALKQAATSSPSEADVILARETSRALAAHAHSGAALSLQVVGGVRSQTIQVPSAAVRMLIRVLEEMARGNAVALIPMHAELTTQEAADLLGISRPTLIQLLEAGEIAFRKAGTHRRVRFDAVMAFKRKNDVARKSALAELSAYDQELGL